MKTARIDCWWHLQCMIITLMRSERIKMICVANWVNVEIWSRNCERFFMSTDRVGKHRVLLNQRNPISLCVS